MLLLAIACYAPSDATGSSDVITPPTRGEDPYTGTPDDTDTSPVDDTGGGDTGSSVEIPPDITPPALTINEVMTKNGFTLSLDGEHPDWIELYNGTPETVALSRISLTDGSGRVWMGGEGEVSPAGFVLIYADGSIGDDHAPFTLDGSGDELTLAVDGYVVDRIATGEMDQDVSWARFPDGGDWAPTIWTTAGESNGTTPSDTLDTNSTLFGLYGVHNVILDIANTSALSSSPTTYTEAVVTIDGSELDTVGVRLRGSSTFRSVDAKCSFKVDLNRYDDLSFRGKKKLHLINMVWDSAHVREYISYYIFREFGVPAARNAYTWVEMNGTDKGLYLLSEVYDDEFLDDWYGNHDGYLWEPNSGDFTSASSWECEEGQPSCDTSVINPIASLLNSSATDANVAAMENYLDLDSVLREIAVEIAVGQWDGYCSPHNYRVYWDPETELASIMPSSVDLTFDNLGYSYGHNYFSCSGRVLSWCLSNTACDARYVDILNELADGIEGDDPATSLNVQETLDEIEVLIEDYQAADASTGLSGFTESQSLSDFANIRQYLIDEPERIRDQIASH